MKKLRYALLLLATFLGRAGMAATLTITGSSGGVTPDILGYNLGHYMDGSNASDWFRYSGVKAARIFLSPSDIEPNDDISPTGDGVNSSSTFFSRRAALRANAASQTATLSSTYIKWSYFLSNYASVSSGGNEIRPSYALGNLRDMGVDILANITASDGRFPITSDSDWAGKWELWQHYYAQAFILSRDYGVRRFSMFNEPNNWSGMTPADWLMRLRICSDAIQCAVADMNSRYGKALVPFIYAPNTANGESKYNTGTDTWGRDAVLNRHLQLDGSTSPGWNNFHCYNYQKYSQYTNDATISGVAYTGYIEDIIKLRGYIASDMGAETAPPLVLSEFNVRTGANYDATSATLDDSTDSVALGANCVALAQNNARQLFLFKFGQTANDAYTYGVTKNGLHYVENDPASPNNYGGATKAAEIYRLFVKAAGASRTWYQVTGTSSILPTSTGGVWTLPTRDDSTGTYYIFIANKKTSSVALGLNVSAFGIPDGNPVLVEEVSTKSSGGVSRFTTVSGGQITLSSANMPSESVWLVTIPSQSAAITSSNATEDTQLADGIFSTATGNINGPMTVRNDGTRNGRKVVLVKIPVPALSASNVQSILLNLSAATTSGNSAVQAHVYGVNSDTWTEAGATWANSTAFLLQNIPDGSDIASNVVAKQGTTTKVLGQLVVSSTLNSERMLDVTDFVKSQTDGTASFLIVQDSRWDVDVSQSALPSGDIQSAGIQIATEDGGATGARLIAISRTTGTSGTAATAPVLLARPQSQNVNAGTNVTFSVTAASTLPVTYQWNKNGVTIASATTASLTLSGVGASDAAGYSVDVTNTAGTTTSSAAVLTLNIAPTITLQPLSQSVNAGDSVTFTIAATGSPAPTFQWSKNGSDIAGADGTSFTFVTSGIGDSGNYTCTVKNAAGTVTSNTAVLTVSNTAGTAISISSTNFVYSQDFYDALEKSHSSYTVTKSNYAPWIDNAILGWYAATDLSGSPFEGYRTFNYQSSEFTTPLAAYSGLHSMGSSSSDKDRALGGFPWSNNKIYFGVCLKNRTGSTLDSFKISYAVEQYCATTVAYAPTTLDLSTQIDAADLKSGTWTSRRVTSPKYYSTSSYKQRDGNSSTNRSTESVTLSGLNLAPNATIWLRWVVSSTSTQPIGMAVDDLTISQFTGSLPATLPVFGSQPQSQTVILGDSVTFSGSATGTPDPVYQWAKDGVPIAGATNASYTIASVTLADVGAYTLSAVNSAGTTLSSTATLSVSTPPAITSHPASQTVAAGGTATFSVSASGNPAPTFQWQKDGVDIPGATSATYVIAGVTLGDAGSYTATANNLADSAVSNAATLTVVAAPIFTTQPKSLGTVLGQSVTFTGEASGNPAPTNQWRKNGTALPGATGTSYTIASVTLASTGTYTLVATNDDGSTASADAILSLGTAPALLTSPTSQRMIIGGTANFSATFSGSPTPTLQWFKNGVAIAGATNTSYSFTTSDIADSGTYTITATNVAGAASGSATLAVYAPGIHIFSASDSYTQNFNTLPRSGSYTIRSGTYNAWTDDSTLTGWFAATDRSPFLGYRTVNTAAATPDFGAAPLSAQSGLASSGSASSTTERALGGLAWSDNRVYFGARLFNRTGQVIDTCTVTYTVEQNTATTSTTTSAITLATQTNAASLTSGSGTWTTRLTTNPVATGTAYTNINGNLAANRVVQTVTLTNLNLLDNQELWVRWAVSTTGSDPVVLGIDDLTLNGFSLTPQAAPTITTSPQSQTMTIGQSLTLTASASGYPAPTLQWYKDGQPIAGATSGTFTLPAATVADAGSYQCIATNGVNSATSSAASINVLTLYQSWIKQQFGADANNPSIASDTADPDGDGLVNLAEYALGRAPLARDGSGMTVTRDSSNLILSYTRRSSATDVTVQPVRSTTLAPGSWSSSGVTNSLISNDGTLQIWQATTPLNAGKAFLRLEIAAP